MAFECGFFNSINKDRLYNANDMNNPYKRIVSNGVFARPSEESSTDFQVLANGTMTVTVSIGDGIFKDKWARLTTPLNITLADSHTLLARIDSIVVKVDETDNVRAGSIYAKSGEYAEEPTPPSLEDTDLIKEYRLANITVGANVESISQAEIEDTRPTSECGWITNLLWDSDITAVYKQWQAQWEQFFTAQKREAEIIKGDISFYNHTLTTEEEDVSEIEASFFTELQYDPSWDRCDVYASGLLLVEGTEYTFNSETRVFTFAKPFDLGTVLQFKVLHKNKKEES